MRYLVLADIHANLEALQAVLGAAQYDRVLLLGDLVGYGADPESCLDTVRALDVAGAVRGNHDKAVAGLDDARSFVAHAREAAHWSRGRLSARNLEYLRELPEGPREVDGIISIAHGSPRDEDEYLVPEMPPRPSLFEAFPTPVCFFGHTHRPTLFSRLGGATYSSRISGCGQVSLDLESTCYLINPGAVGQPRDRDPRAAFLIYDSGASCVEFNRVEYDIASAQRKILAAGLPELLARRLDRGD